MNLLYLSSRLAEIFIPLPTIDGLTLVQINRRTTLLKQTLVFPNSNNGSVVLIVAVFLKLVNIFAFSAIISSFTKPIGHCFRHLIPLPWYFWAYQVFKSFCFSHCDPFFRGFPGLSHLAISKRCVAYTVLQMKALELSMLKE